MFSHSHFMGQMLGMVTESSNDRANGCGIHCQETRQIGGCIQQDPLGGKNGCK